jgi:hypothetical protein
VKVAPTKVALVKKISFVRVVRPKMRLGSRGTSKIELALTKLIGVSKKICFSEGGPMMQTISEHATRVIKFASLGDSLPDTHWTSPPGRTAVTDAPMLPIATPGWCLLDLRLFVL